MKKLPAAPGGELAYLRAEGALGLDCFYRDHAGLVLRWAIRLGDASEDPEDIAQEVFEVALKRLDSFRGDSSVKTWLFGITRKVLANHRRRASFRRMVGLSEVPEPSAKRAIPDEELEQVRQRRKVQRALTRLKVKQREVLVLLDLEGMTAVEASSLLGVPVGTIYSRLHTARKLLAKALTAEGVTRVSTAEARVASLGWSQQL